MLDLSAQRPARIAIALHRVVGLRWVRVIDEVGHLDTVTTIRGCLVEGGYRINRDHWGWQRVRPWWCGVADRERPDPTIITRDRSSLVPVVCILVLGLVLFVATVRYA